MPNSLKDSMNTQVVARNSSTINSLKLDTERTPCDSHDDHLTVELIKARSLSELINLKFPRTPIMTPPNEPETINSWELMAGLEGSTPPVRYSFSFHTNNKCDDGAMHHDRRVILYFTSIRGVRKTYEDCCLVRSIVKGYGVRVDERDVSMHRGFRDELCQILGVAQVRLPSLFANGKYLGGAEEVKQMHEGGKLELALRRREEVVDEKGGSGGETTCAACGAVRFVLCERCSGSCKLYVDDGEEQEEMESGFQRCPECNENGIVRCPICC
ncbi:uncharacterized protein At5g39865-like [Typha latifolia]|uniref:uncharacterized protein At5g39865-like n=1 Tax=Typha latifolia TaxID=4733 RepID=UPI003C304996